MAAFSLESLMKVIKIDVSGVHGAAWLETLPMKAAPPVEFPFTWAEIDLQPNGENMSDVTTQSREVTIFQRVGEVLVGATTAVNRYEATQTWLENASKMDSIIGAASKAVDERRKLATVPINEGLKQINAMFGEPRKALDEARAELKGYMSKAHLAITAEAEEEARAAQKIAEEQAIKEAEVREAAGDTVGADQVLDDAAAMSQGSTVPTGPIRTDMGTRTSFIDNWTFEIEDHALVPREFLILTVDLEQLRAHAKENENKIPVAGVRFYNDPTVRSTT